jgi:sterol 3beta-glucosyltransferase
VAHILIVTVGTRGDVVPFTGLGGALRAAGHRVTIATHASLRPHVEGAGLGFATLPVEFGPGGPQAAPLTPAVLVRTLARNWLDIGRAIDAAAGDADLLLLGALGWLGYHVAEARGVPSMGAFLQPLEPTREFPPATMTTRSLGGRGNVAAAHWLRVAGQLPFARQTAALRRELGLPPLGPAATFRRLAAEQWPVLHGFSPSVLPPPADWPARCRVTGYWWPPVEAPLSPRVQRFLDEGEPPVYFGFGSMRAPGLGDLVRDTVRAIDGRAVVHRGAAGLTAGGPDVLVIEDEPHAELFPRMSAIVHHAGAGTTAAALRAGVPSVCVPVTADQPFWADRIHAVGAGPRRLRRRGLTAGRLADAIEEAASCRPAAAAMSGRLATEDGAGVALAEIERLLPVR